MKSCCCILFLLSMVVAQAADPGAKPRLKPRAIPGIERNTPSTSSAGPSLVIPRTAAAPAYTPDANSPNQARIIAIYRRGTFSLPAEAAPVDPVSTPEAAVSKPAPPAAPRPGQVRILTKAELDQLAAQPSP